MTHVLLQYINNVPIINRPVTNYKKWCPILNRSSARPQHQGFCSHSLIIFWLLPTYECAHDIYSKDFSLTNTYRKWMCAKSIICLSYYQKHVLMHCITSYTTSAVFKKHAPMLCNTKVRDAAVWRYSQMGYLKQEIGHSFRSIPSSGVFLKSILQICNLHTPDFLENFCCIKFLYTGTPNFYHMTSDEHRRAVFIYPSIPVLIK